ncbi:Protein CLT3 chloroplastic [Zea mays]|uniref:Protein CLT3 chloroplastic n=1 Tax=Zea mays TaxID=4577 RepID=A0A1D6G458_MAIZE|nr:Protein CLT3 chloroplastic [Zea mays]
MAPSPVTCRPSAARHRPLLVRAPAPRAADGAALMLPLPLRRREALLAAAARPHARWIAADPWASAHAWTSPGRGRGDATRCAAAGRVAGSSSAGAGRSAGMEVAIAAAAVVAMGTGNRVLYKLALVPLREYPFFLAQFATFGYVVVYFSILYLRYQAGIVTDEMLSLPQKPFLVVGLLEAFAAAAGMAAGGSLFVKTYLVWQLLLSAIFLKRRYRINEIAGCFLVTVGVIITVARQEIIFLDASKKLKCGSVDLFVVNSYGSAYQSFKNLCLCKFRCPSTLSPYHCRISVWHHLCHLALLRVQQYSPLAYYCTAYHRHDILEILFHNKND